MFSLHLPRTGLLTAMLWLGLTHVPAFADDVSALAPEDRREIEKLLGKDLIVEALPGRPLLAPEQYLPQKTGGIVYEVRGKEKRPTEERHDITSDSAGNYTYEIKGVSRREMSVGDQEHGGITKEFDFDQDVVSTFNPPQPLIVPGLKPGESHTVKVAVSVADIDDPSDEDYSGELDIIYQPLGRYRIKVPAGTFDADLIKWTYAGDIGPADVETTQYRFIAEGAGLVAMVEFRSVSAVLVYHENTKVGRLLKRN